jgi:hypothetical protein
MTTGFAPGSSLRRRQFPAFVKRQVIWARHPFVCRLGRLIGIALESRRLLVAIYTPTGPRWFPAELALDSAEAQAWASFGFHRA